MIQYDDDADHKNVKEIHDKFKELCCLICDGGEIVFMQCNPGEGVEGARLNNLLSSLCDHRITITTFTSECVGNHQRQREEAQDKAR